MKHPESFRGQPDWTRHLAQQTMDRTNVRLRRIGGGKPKNRLPSPDTGINQADFRSILPLYSSLAHGFILLTLSSMLMSSTGCAVAPTPGLTPASATAGSYLVAGEIRPTRTQTPLPATPMPTENWIGWVPVPTIDPSLMITPFIRPLPPVETPTPPALSPEANPQTIEGTYPYVFTVTLSPADPGQQSLTCTGVVLEDSRSGSLLVTHNHCRPRDLSSIHISPATTTSTVAGFTLYNEVDFVTETDGSVLSIRTNREIVPGGLTFLRDPFYIPSGTPAVIVAIPGLDGRDTSGNYTFHVKTVKTHIIGTDQFTVTTDIDPSLQITPGMSGGPIFIQGADGSWQVAAIMSVGYGFPSGDSLYNINP